MLNKLSALIILGIYAATALEAESLPENTYWVAATGAATWQSCRGATPLAGNNACSVATALTNAVAGDTVYFRGGTYNGVSIAPANSGTAELPLTFSAYDNEEVILTNQYAANRSMETQPWPVLGGASVSRSAERKWDGVYSTRFSVSAAGQGIQSEPFKTNMREITYYACIYSEQDKINVTFARADSGGEVYNQDLNLVPGKWTCTVSPFVNLAEAANVDVRMIFRAPQGVGNRTWYVDGVRIHRYDFAFYLAGKDYIKIKNFKVQAVRAGFILLNGANFNEISGCTFTDIDSYAANMITGTWNSTVNVPSTHNWIHHNTFHDNGYIIWSASYNRCWESGNQLRIGTGQYDNSGYNLIEDNLFYHSGHDHILVETKYNTIRNNVFHNEGWMPNNYGSNGCGPDSSGANPPVYNNPQAGYGARNLLFENPADNSGYNLVEGNRLGYAGTPPVHDGANGIENPTDGNIFRYNFIYGNGTTGFYFKQQSGNPDYNHIYNNTIYANGGGEDIDPGYQAGIKCNCWQTSFTGNVVKNNIIFANAGAGIKPGNCSQDTMTRLNTFTDNYELDPGFINPDMSDKYSLNLPDLRLKADSGAVDKAAPLTQVGAGDSGQGTTLVVADAAFFQDGTWGPPGKLEADWIAVGAVDRIVQIAAINYASNTILLKSPITRAPGDNVWLSRISTGKPVLSGRAPDHGASEYSTASEAPRNLRLQIH